MRPRRAISLAILLAAIIVTGPTVGDALAKQQKARFSALVAGKRLKVKRAIFGTYVSTGFGVIAQAPPRRRVARALSIDCLGDIKTIPLPAVVPQCLGTYTEKKLRGGGLKQWTSLGMEVTVGFFDGSKLVGTFRGVIQPSTSNPTDPPVAVEGGSFTVFVRSLGI
jgi:hypothetical protein